MGWIGIAGTSAIILGIIFGIAGFVVTGTLIGALVGLLLPIFASLVCIVSIVPFGGAYLFWMWYPLVSNWLLESTGYTASLGIVATISLYIFTVIGAIITIITSIVGVALIIDGTALVASIFKR
jgi:hypothetical protein